MYPHNKQITIRKLKDDNVLKTYLYHTNYTIKFQAIG
ncbi:unnamed protein product [Spodoptera exigua]|nr:unnamed protein product [Spodoptera exigua]